ncbi:MAG: 4Fe-4S dicluster domain-containing protein [Campylobacter sp.]|nr:4Fe-4S dicluster domain-containing protein [Campylobacter sp.]
MNRREFTGASLLALLALGGSYAVKLNAKNDTYLRPPRSSPDFDKLCIKCGQCVQVCPYYAISLLDITSGVDIGTAHIDPKKRGCYLCDLLPCVLACPSGALNPDSLEREDANMGVVTLTNFNECLSLKGERLSPEKTEFLTSRKTHNEREAKVVEDIKNSNGEICDLCVKLCPIGSSAIELDEKNLPRIKEGCVGCGVCVEVCPVGIIEAIPHKKFSEVYKD